MKKVGVKLYACKACADLYGVSDKLSQLGLERERSRGAIHIENLDLDDARGHPAGQTSDINK